MTPQHRSLFITSLRFACAKYSPLLSPSLWFAMKKRASTLQDVAAEAGVSRAAAGRVLLGTGGERIRVGEEAAERITAAAKRLNYTPNRSAQQLRGIAGRTIGVIVCSNNTPVMAERVFTLEAEAAARGYRLLVGRCQPQGEDLASYVEDFSGRSVEAIFCLFDLAPGRDALLRKGLRSFGRVLFHGRPAWQGGYCVRTDTAGAIATALAHLAASGKRRPALALWNRGQDELMEVRNNAFIEGCAALKLGRAAQRRVWDAASETVTPARELLDAGIEAMVRHNRADAILASNDIWAVRIIQKLKEYGLRVPEDVSVIGHDNLDIGTVIEPQLTTIDPDHAAYAQAAMALLLRIAAGEPVPKAQRTVTVPSRLLVRGST